MNERLKKRLEAVEQKHNPDALLVLWNPDEVVVLCDTTQSPKLYEIPSLGKKLNEAEYQAWCKTLGPDCKLFVIEIWLNRPEGCVDV
ncbi:MAG: hypothetical protein ABSD42_04535 [Candidatus Bathyarchaeia archaeon]|jgi:hypothetical protein